MTGNLIFCLICHCYMPARDWIFSPRNNARTIYTFPLKKYQYETGRDEKKTTAARLLLFASDSRCFFFYCENNLSNFNSAPMETTNQQQFNLTSCGMLRVGHYKGRWKFDVCKHREVGNSTVGNYNSRKARTNNIRCELIARTSRRKSDVSGVWQLYFIRNGKFSRTNFAQTCRGAFCETRLGIVIVLIIARISNEI